ncbi:MULTISPECIES: PDZ domain-containing protein [unclassified Streptomyces]|uniref:PDZ domain-containing protein n=1 Tax=unclassified Streptomyces TaxID=2593676 RepID=UPI0033ABC438
MEQAALRAKPMPGQNPGGGDRPGGGTRTYGGDRTSDGTRPSGESRRPHAARRRGRRLVTLLTGLFVGSVLVLSGVGLGAVGATVIGLNRLADVQKQAGAAGHAQQPSAGSGAPRPGGSGVPGSDSPRTESGTGSPIRSGESDGQFARGTLGVEAVDAPDRGGALIVAVHVPGPGCTAGLVSGDVLLAFGGTGVTSAAGLARAVADATPGREVTLRVRHANGVRGRLSAVPGIAT